MRITINGKRLALFTKRTIKPELWDVSKGMCRGKTQQARDINNFIEAFRTKVFNKHTELMSSYEEVTPELLRDSILCINTAKSRSLCSIWEEHIADLKRMIGKETSYANYQKYSTALRYMKEFLLSEYQMKDVPIKLLNRQMVVKFELFLRTNKFCNFNTTTKYLQNFKRILMIAFRNGWLKVNPFADFKLTLREVDRPYLTEDELKNVMELEILMPRLELVRDLFVFSCFSGLAYSDLFKLKGSEIERDPKGILWIKTRRQKTKVKAQIPLLHIPTFIIEKYCDLSILKAEQKVLPVLSNQKLNSYLKEIQTLARNEKTFTFHMARHTFATTVTMMNGVPIESVARMLGHKNIKTTQHYARIVDTKIGNDMMDLAQKLGNRFIMPTSPAI